MENVSVLPEKFIAKLHSLVPPSDYDAILTTFTTEKTLSIRTNTLKTTTAALTRCLKDHQIPFIPVSWYEDAFILPNTPKSVITSLKEYQEGHCYIQNLSSMIPSLVLNPKPGEKVLDLCAAPGSKTTMMASLMQNTGEITANDRSRQRLFKLQANLKEQGVTNTKVISYPGEIIWKMFPNTFDKVLVDAPCSMEGRFLTTDPESFKDWSPKKVKLLSQTQKWLLRSAVTATRPGGTIVYSTCTLSPEENEEVIDWLLRTEPYPLTIEKINLPQGLGTTAREEWDKHRFEKGVSNSLRIHPTESLEGFFVAKITKS